MRQHAHMSQTTNIKDFQICATTQKIVFTAYGHYFLHVERPLLDDKPIE